LLGQKAGGFHRRLVTIVKIASQQQGIDAFFEAKVDNAYEGSPCCIADQIGKIRVAEGK
jgi:hypothetical protein